MANANPRICNENSIPKAGACIGSARLSVQHSVEVKASVCNDKDVGSNPAATRNENTDFGQTLAQKVPQ